MMGMGLAESTRAMRPSLLGMRFGGFESVFLSIALLGAVGRGRSWAAVLEALAGVAAPPWGAVRALSGSLINVHNP